MGFSISGGIGLVALIATLSIALTTSAYAYNRGSSTSVTQVINQLNTVKNGGTGTNTASNTVTISGHGTTHAQTPQTSSQVMGTQGVGLIPSQTPINVCGNIVNVIGSLNPSFGNVCNHNK